MELADLDSDGNPWENLDEIVRVNFDNYIETVKEKNDNHTIFFSRVYELLQIISHDRIPKRNRDSLLRYLRKGLQQRVHEMREIAKENKYKNPYKKFQTYGEFIDTISDVIFDKPLPPPLIPNEVWIKYFNRHCKALFEYFVTSNMTSNDVRGVLDQVKALENLSIRLLDEEEMQQLRSATRIVYKVRGFYLETHSNPKRTLIQELDKAFDHYQALYYIKLHQLRSLTRCSINYHLGTNH